MAKLFEIGRKKLLRKARRIEKRDVSNLSNEALLKIVNRHNASKKLKRIFEKLGRRNTFTNSEIDKAIKLSGLSFKELKKLANKRMIKSFDSLSEDQLYYVVISTNRSPLEDNSIEFMNKDFRNEVKERINHVLFLMTKLENKGTNKEKESNN